jgi:hypothetical protein
MPKDYQENRSTPEIERGYRLERILQTIESWRLHPDADLINYHEHNIEDLKDIARSAYLAAIEDVRNLLTPKK